MSTRLLHRALPSALLLAGFLPALVLSTAQAQVPPLPVSPAPVLSLAYDANGNFTKATKGGFATSNSYDSLNRRRLTTDARAKTTQLGYTGRDDLTSVVDPRRLLTQVPRNGLGDVTGLVSPDTGTRSDTLNAAGQLLTRTDARGVVAAYSYDMLNRPTSLTYSWGSQSPMAFTWTYDQTGAGFAYGVGRLTSTGYPGGATRYAYDAQGRLVAATQFTYVGSSLAAPLQTQYGYNPVGQLVSLVYPSGRVLSISYSGGLPYAMSLQPGSSGTPIPLISQIQHEPFGDVHSWSVQLATGPQVHERLFDDWGRMARYPVGGFLRDLTYDAAGRIVSTTHRDRITGQATPSATALNQSFGYDELDRLISATGATNRWTYSYDDNGNRTSATATGTSYTNSTYSVDANSNRLLSISNPTRQLGYDGAGNTIMDISTTARWTPGYDLSNRLAGLSGANSSGQAVSLGFLYNADGLRVAKLVQAKAAPCAQNICPAAASVDTTTLYVHDQGGRLLGEYNASDGSVIREYVWLGDIPVVAVDKGGNGTSEVVYFIHADHLNTPRAVTDQAGQVRWTWDGEPFGNSAPNSNPSSLGPLVFNLRFPGQYFDVESGFVNNGFRVFDPSVGRYTQSDPIGLAGGINTYTYALNQPTKYTDPTGQWAFLLTPQFWMGVSAIVAGGMIVNSQNHGNVIPFPSRAAPSTVSDSNYCPPDDSCMRNQQRLMKERTFLVDATALGPLDDLETKIAISNEIVKYNREVDAHNRQCPNLPVPKLRPLR